MQIRRVVEYEIDPGLNGKITSLRNACFPDCQVERSYYKQLPHFRFLAMEGARVVGHMGIDHRNYGVGIEEIAGEVMVKPLVSQFEIRGPIDFLGYMF